MKFICIIPARYASTRFPGKPLAMLGNKTVIQHVYERACGVLSAVFVATDDIRIFSAVEAFGGKAVMTRADHRSGTDRVREAYENIGVDADVIINIQGDEPFIAPEQITALMSCFENASTDIATLISPTENIQLLQNPNVVKTVVDAQGRALYFSRALIPYHRDTLTTYYRHIGIYAYRSDALYNITQWEATPLECSESLEQLRWLEHGLHIQTALTTHETIGIDTPEDLLAAQQILQNR